MPTVLYCEQCVSYIVVWKNCWAIAKFNWEMCGKLELNVHRRKNHYVKL